MGKSTAKRTPSFGSSFKRATHSLRGERRGSLACMPSRPSTVARNPSFPKAARRVSSKPSQSPHSQAGESSSIRSPTARRASCKALCKWGRLSVSGERGQSVARKAGLPNSRLLAAITASPPLCPLPTRMSRRLPRSGLLKSPRSKRMDSAIASPAWFITCHSRSSSPLKNSFSKARDWERERTGSMGRVVIFGSE